MVQINMCFNSQPLTVFRDDLSSLHQYEHSENIFLQFWIIPRKRRFNWWIGNVLFIRHILYSFLYGIGPRIYVWEKFTSVIMKSFKSIYVCMHLVQNDGVPYLAIALGENLTVFYLSLLFYALCWFNSYRAIFSWTII